jgi:hypothetical protein
MKISSEYLIGILESTLFLNANRSKLMKKIKLEMAVVILIFLAVSIKALL